MTRASAAAETGLPSDRRSLLTGAALASLVAATGAAPAMAAEPVGPIEAAYAIWRKAARAADVACEATWGAEDRYEEPDRPGWHPALSEGGYKMVNRPNNMCRVYLSDTPENIAKLRAIIASSFVPDPTHADTPFAHASRVERARATLDKIEAWQTECRKRADACGLTAAREHEKPLTAEMRRVQADLLGMTPSTLREAAFQAAVLTLDWDERAACFLVERLAELAGIPSYHLGEA